MTNREKWMLIYLLEFPVHRYLLSNSFQRIDGFEKAQRHIEISKLIVRFIFLCDENSKQVVKYWIIVHDYLSEILTSKMDEVIEFPLHEPLYGSEVFGILSKRFLDVIIQHMDNIFKLVGVQEAGDDSRFK